MMKYLKFFCGLIYFELMLLVLCGLECYGYGSCLVSASLAFVLNTAALFEWLGTKLIELIEVKRKKKKHHHYF